MNIHRARALFAAFLLLIARSGLAQTPGVTLNTNACIPFPPDAAWNQYINFRPVSNEVVTLNPPIFNWCYVPGGAATGATDSQEYNFILQVENDNSFTNPVINLATPCNFYNFLPPIQNTNGTIYWRVGYIPVANTNLITWITNSFQISGTATNWDRSMLADAGFLSGRTNHPHMGFTITNRAAVSNWLTTNQLPWAKNSWAVCRSQASNSWSQSWYTNYASTVLINNNAYYNTSQDLTAVAFMWQMTRNPYWTNQNPTPMTVMTNLVNWYITNEMDQADDVGFDPQPEWWVNFGYFYDWMYDAMDAGQRNMFLTAFHYRALFLRDSIGWWRRAYGITPDSNSTGAYTNRIYPGPFSVYYHSDAKNANTHAHQNFETDYPVMLAAFGDDSVVSNVWNLGANYILGVSFIDGHAGGPGQGRGYNMSEIFGPGGQALFTWNNAMCLNNVFPESQVMLNPSFGQTAQFMEMQTPVNFYELNDPWGDGVGSTTRNWYAGANGQWSKFGIVAMLTGSGQVQSHFLNQNAITGDGNSYEPYSFILPFQYPPPTPTTNNVLAQAWPEDGWVIGMSSTANQSSCYANGVGFIFCARPRGSLTSWATGHSTECDLEFQIWAYGANVTDGGDSYGSSFAHCSWSHYTPTINGIGQYQNPDEQTHPWYARILAYTNGPDYVYCAADGTALYPYDQRSVEDLTADAPRNAVIETNPTNVLSGLTSVTRQILFQHRRYFIIFDSFTATSNYTYSIPYQVMEPTLSNQNGASFTYTCSNQMSAGKNVTVYVSQVVNSNLLGVINMTGTSTNGFSVKTDPITGDNEWGDFNPIFYDDGIYIRSNVVWISNLTPTNKFHFMTVIYPVPPGGAAPVIQRLDDYTVSVTAGGSNDVISFDPNTTNSPTFLIDSPSIVGTTGMDYSTYSTGAPITSGGGGGGGGSSGGGGGGGQQTTSQPLTAPGNPRVFQPWTTNLLAPLPANLTTVDSIYTTPALTGSSSQTPFAPVPGFSVWWNPDILPAPNNAAVSSWLNWNDFVNSTANLVAYQTNGAMQPTVALQGQNMHNYLECNGSAHLQCTNCPLQQPCEVFIVAQPATTNTSGYSILLGDHSYAASLLVGTDNGQYCIYAGGANLAGSVGTNWQVITAILNGANSQLFTNGVPVVSCSIKSSASTTSVDIGTYDNGANGGGWVGAIGDIIIYPNVLSTANQQAVENGLRAKYGF